jgi:hypothetical protein
MSPSRARAYGAHVRSVEFSQWAGLRSGRARGPIQRTTSGAARRSAAVEAGSDGESRAKRRGFGGAERGRVALVAGSGGWSPQRPTR